MASTENNQQKSGSSSETLHLVAGKYALQEGEQFDSYEALMQRMTLHTKESMVHYWHRDSRTVKNAYTKTSRPIAAQLKYYSIRFACIYSDMNKDARTNRTRAVKLNHRRTDCQAYILFRASKSGNALEVASVCNVHNHEISETMNERLPQTRRMSADVKEEVLEMLKLQIDRKKILEYVQIRENKIQTMKSIFNLSARLRSAELFPLDGEKRIIVLQRLIRFAKDERIHAIISNELANYDLDESTYYEVENDDHLIEYISPDHEFGVNETIIESIVESRHHRIGDSPLSDSSELSRSDAIECGTVVDPTTVNDESTLILYNSSFVDNNPKDDIFIDNNEIIKDSISPASQIEVENQNFSLQSNHSSIASDSNIIEYVHGDDNEDSETAEIFTTTNPDLPASNNYSVVLYETTTDVVSGIENRKDNKESDVGTIKIATEKCSVVKKSVKKIAKRISMCSKCRTDFRLVRAQVDYLKAKRKKLLEETRILKMKKKKLLDEIHRMK